MKKVIVLLLTLALLLSLALTSYALETPDPSRPSSLTLVMEWDDKPLDSGSLTLYRVGEIADVDGDYTFVLISELKESGLSLENLEDTNLPQQLQNLAVERKLEAVSVSIRNGEATFDDLMPGLYVVTQRFGEACDGFSLIRPFLISLPRWNGSGYIYDLTAQPKVSLEEEPTEPTETEPTAPTDPRLPQTGQLNWPVPTMAVAGLAFLVAGWLLCFGKKERNEE